MNIISSKNSQQYDRSGMTLIEIILYTTLLSFLMATSIEYLYTIQIRNAALMDAIDREQNKGGFIATTAIILLSTGCLAFLLVVSATSMSYADSVSRREYRIQKALNERACLETRDLILAKDHFFTGSSTIPELYCVIKK